MAKMALLPQGRWIDPEGRKKSATRILSLAGCSPGGARGEAVEALATTQIEEIAIGSQGSPEGGAIMSNLTDTGPAESDEGFDA